MTKLLHTALAVSALFGLAGTASAQFAGAYDPALWTVSHTVDDSGSVDASAAPLAITLIGSDNSTIDLFGQCTSGTCSPSRLAFTITATHAGTYSFDWAYATQDATSAEWDPAGYLINASSVPLSVDAGPNSQGGHVSFVATQGSVIGFYVDTLDNTSGAAQLTISNFTAPVPEPGSTALLLAGLAGMALWRRRAVAR